MKIILTLDNNNGMMFNHRRQSRDRVLLAHLTELVGSARLLMSHYTAKLFSDGLPPGAVVADDFLSLAADDDFCFVEDDALTPWEDKIGMLYIFRWNRDYPADRVLDLDPARYRCVVLDEFPGSSHDKITLETWEI